MSTQRQQRGTVPTSLLQALADGSRLRTADLAAALDVSRTKISDAASRLAARGYLERHTAGHYQLTPEGLTAAAAGIRITSGTRNGMPVFHDSLRQRAWRAMRVRRMFTTGDLVSDAARDGEDGYKHIQRYLRQLQTAGYVANAGRTPGARSTSNGFRVYALTRDTGPLAPIYREASQVLHDRNTGRSMPCSRCR